MMLDAENREVFKDTRSVIAAKCLQTVFIIKIVFTRAVFTADWQFPIYCL